MLSLSPLRIICKVNTRPLWLDPVPYQQPHILSAHLLCLSSEHTQRVHTCYPYLVNTPSQSLTEAHIQRMHTCSITDAHTQSFTGEHTQRVHTHNHLLVNTHRGCTLSVHYWCTHTILYRWTHTKGAHSQSLTRAQHTFNPVLVH